MAELTYRFNPKNTQTLPGQDVSIGVTMTPLQDMPEPCPECPCASDTVGWAIQPTPGKTYPFNDNGVNYTRHLWVMPLLFTGYIKDQDGNADSNDAGRPIMLRMHSLPAYTNPHRSWLFLGLPFGDANGIRWEWAWNISSELPTAPTDPANPTAENWWAGSEIYQVGNLLHVRVLHGHYASYSESEYWSAELTARAYCGDIEVGVLRLKIEIFATWN